MQSNKLMASRPGALLALLVLAACSITPAARAAMADGDYLILISIDGYRHDYPDLYPTPALSRLAERGVRARSLRPVWPTLTFPNHYSIATGLYPVEHGIVGNHFPAATRDEWYSYRNRDAVQDGDWYGGVPVWVAAERAGLGSAAFYFVGTEAPVGGVLPGEWRPFDDDVDGGERVAQALDWLARPLGTRPQVVTLYFEHVDMASHRYGPGSPESIAAMQRVDGWLQELFDGVAELPHGDRVHFVVVSDHGQTRTRRDVEPFALESVVDLEGVSLVEHGSVAMAWLDDPGRAAGMRDRINAAWAHGRAWLPAEAPAYWRVRGNGRMPDLLLQPDPGYVVIGRREGAGHLTVGDHGWAPGFEAMHGIFLAAGPRLPRGETVGTVDAVEVYPLLLGILGLADPREAPHPSSLTKLLR